VGDEMYAVADALADSDLGREILTRTLSEIRAGAWDLLSCQVTDVWKQRRKRIVFCRVSYRTMTDRRVRTTDIVVKVYGCDRGAPALGALSQLWEAGFRPPARYRVPRPYGYLPAQGTLLQASAPGAAWASFLRGDERVRWAASDRAGAWLVRLQRSPVSAEARRWEVDAAATRRCASELAASFPQYGPRLAPVAARLIPLLRAEGIPRVPSHGDYHPKNVFLTAGLATVIDFDTFGVREAAFDVGYAIGQLLIMSYFQLGDLGPGASAALAFWRRCQLGGHASWTRVAVQVARTFLQSLHFELCTLRNGRVELFDLWLYLMEEWLDSAGPAILERLRADPVDARLREDST
jgi:Phosphotransferase enzyme family